MINIFTIIQLVSAGLLIVAVLLQQKGSGLGAAFGGSSNIYSAKRGLDKFLFKTTIIISIIFFGVSFWQLVI